MNNQKIKFGNKSIEVIGCYPFLISQNTGKTVLRISVMEADTTFNDLYELKNNVSGIIEYYTRNIQIDPETQEEVVGEWELKNTYEDYNSGEIEISYKDSVYQCDITHMGEYEKEIAQNRADIDYVAIMTGVDL